MVYHSDLIHNIFDNLVCLSNAQNNSKFCYYMDKMSG